MNASRIFAEGIGYCVCEINALTDIVDQVRIVKNGRKFEKIKFFIREKSSQELLLVEKSAKNSAIGM